MRRYLLVPFLLFGTCRGVADNTTEDLARVEGAVPVVAPSSRSGTRSETRSETYPELQQELRQLSQTADAESARLTALERYLEDRVAAPKGWVQPTLEKYAEPGAPKSFLPSYRAAPVTETETGAAL